VLFNKCICPLRGSLGLAGADARPLRSALSTLERVQGIRMPHSKSERRQNKHSFWSRLAVLMQTRQ